MGFLRLTALTVAVIVFTADIFAVLRITLTPLFTSDELATSNRSGRLRNLYEIACGEPGSENEGQPKKRIMTDAICY